MGQSWFLSGYDGVSVNAGQACTSKSNPWVATEFPSKNPVVTNRGDYTRGF
jgi:hypothetical protein